jgi:O-antigen ligase
VLTRRAPEGVLREESPDRGRDLVAVALQVIVVLICVPSVTVLWHDAAGAADPNLRVGVSAIDVPLAGLTVLWLLGLRRRPRLHGRAPVLAVAAVGLGLVALTVHPSPRGFELALRLVACVAVVDLVRRLDAPGRSRVAGTLAVVGVAQALLGIAQALAGRALGLGPFELAGPLYRFGSSHAGRGSLTHPYHLAVVLLVAMAVAVVFATSASRPLPWLAAVGVCAAGVGVTYSRAAALGLVAAVVVLAVAGLRTRHRTGRNVLAGAALVIVLGFGVTALGLGDGWHARYRTSTEAATADSGRVDSARDALGLIEDHPLVGVGPGRYVVSLAATHHRGFLQPPHDLALHAMAELGIVAGLAVTALAAIAAVRRLRAGAGFAAATVLIAPFFLFDAYPYAFPVGLAVTALWLGLVDPQDR